MIFILINLGLEKELVDRNFDRAHRAGSITDREGDKVKERLSSKRGGKSIATDQRLEGRVRTYVDRTKRCFKLRKLAADYIKKKPEVDFVFVEINWSLCIRLKFEQYKLFISEE